MLRIAVFGSGRGSNFMSIVDAIEQGELPVKIVKVIVNEPKAPMIDRAKENYLDVVVIPHQGINRTEHEAKIMKEIRGNAIDLICLAGYMRILSKEFLSNIGLPIINIHPSLLPSFPGLNAQKQAFEYGVKVTGCTVHQVNEVVDGGKILGQTCVEVKDGDSVESLSARILRAEHELYPKVLHQIVMGEISLDN